MRRALLFGFMAGLCACGVGAGGGISGEIPFTAERPSLGEAAPAVPYTGSDPLVLEAQLRYPTGLELHRKVILRSCGPTNGVCHNQKEYPDLHTAGTFAAAVAAPCNVQPGGWSSVFDRCERLGDRFRLKGEAAKEVEIGWIELIPGEYVNHRERGTRPDESSPGLHLQLFEPLPADIEDPRDTGLFFRSFVDSLGLVQALVFANFETRWWVIGDRRHLVAEVRENQVDAVNALLAAGIVQGDMNRNGIFGARAGRTVPLINPGKPEESYLVARLRGLMQGERVPGTRMPLANQPPSIPDMVGLMCFIEGLSAQGPMPAMTSAIRYGDCSYTANPAALNLVGDGVTWSDRVRPLLQASCGGCHGGANPQGGLDLLAEDAHTRLLGPSTQKTNLNLVQAGSPEKSYLWLKLVGDGSIIGTRMPVDPLGAGTQLPQEALDDLETWILAGALP